MESHLTQWRHNRAFLRTVKPEFPDWAVTVAFYTAVHAIDALFSHDNLSVVNHLDRNGKLQNNNRYSKLWTHYYPLWTLSRTVRYFGDPALWVAWPDIHQQVIVRSLYPIEKSVGRLIRRDLESLDGPIVLAAR